MKKMHLPIWAKILIIVFSFVMVVTAVIAKVSYDNFEQTLLQREEYSNINDTKYKSNQIEQMTQSLIQKSSNLAKSLQENPDFSLTDNYILGLEIWDIGSNVLQYKSYNQSYIEDKKLNLDYFSSINAKTNWDDKIRIKNVSDKVNAIGLISIPFIQLDGKTTHYLVINFDLKYFQTIFQDNGLRNGFITNYLGEVISHSNDHYVVKKEEFKSELINESDKEPVLLEKQIQFREGNEDYIGAFVKSPNYDLKIFTQTNKKVILEPAIKVKHNIYYVAGIVLSIAIFIVYLFATSLTSSISILSALIKKVGQGDFTVQSKQYIKTLFSDETTDLAENFDKMTVGLLEREKVKNILNKFHGQAITEDLLNKELKVGGEKKEVVVFFSDIRGFTAYSESHSPEEVVSMLNEYLELMVGIITKRGGIVDKFIGDAIMAVWGAPKGSESDAHNAVMACIEMRESLAKLNETRIQRGQEPILIGMGLHTGLAISGIIGSHEKMEYTIIGDTVNMTSRLEASTKTMGTDLLISNEVVNKVKDKILIEKAGAVSVKGKVAPIDLYKVNGYINKNNIETIVKTKYSVFEKTEDEKVKKSS